MCLLCSKCCFGVGKIIERMICNAAMPFIWDLMGHDLQADCVCWGNDNTHHSQRSRLNGAFDTPRGGVVNGLV